MATSNTLDINTKTSNLTITDIRYLPGTLTAPANTSSPTIVKKSGSHWVVTVKCDREGSKSRATVFNNACGGYYHEYVPKSYGIDDEPSELNFCFAVAITFSYKNGDTTTTAVAPVVYFAQGHAGARNNWWIGGYETVANADNKNPLLLASGGDTGVILKISGGFSNIDFTWKSKSIDVALNKWMKKVADGTSLYNMSLPGTHDTCALYGGDAAITQRRSLIDQLNSGIRFIDIRCRHIENIFAIHHGLVYEKINFGDGVLKVCLDFLAKNPSETIIMSVKPEYDPSKNTRTFEETFNWYIQEYHCAAQWYFNDTVPNLKAVRGKIVLFRRFETDEQDQILGLKAEPWKENATFEITNAASMKIQDQYKVATLFDRGKKWDKIKTLLNEADSGGKNTLYVNYCSGTSSGCYPYSVANYVNPHLTNYLAENIKGRFGAVLMDFETSDLSRLVIDTNF